MDEPRMNRRSFLKFSGGAAAGVATGAALTGSAYAAAEGSAENLPQLRATLPYPKHDLARAGDLRVNEPVTFHYPDNRSRCMLLKTGQEAPGGVGPDGDIVAFSMICPHMGMPLNYDAEARTLKCPGHFSIFDPEQAGRQVCGQATENSPQIELQYDSQSDKVIATGVHGLIFGRASNLL